MERGNKNINNYTRIKGHQLYAPTSAKSFQHKRVRHILLLMSDKWTNTTRKPQIPLLDRIANQDCLHPAAMKSSFRTEWSGQTRKWKPGMINGFRWSVHYCQRNSMRGRSWWCQMRHVQFRPRKAIPCVQGDNCKWTHYGKAKNLNNEPVVFQVAPD